MTFVKWALGLLILAAYAAALHYSLPSRDVVRVVGTDVVRMDLSSNVEQGGQTLTRDQMRINTITADGRERVYRNEDTDWSFPWYFKFDSADVTARADNLISTEEAPKWVIVTHYGWRWPFMSWFPNAITLERVDGPDQDLTPWGNIIFVTVLTLGLIILFRLVQLFFRRNVDPVLDELDEQRGAFTRFVRGLFT